ncbi:DUF5753 domain-containing protein [Streptomyces sp. NPDC056716]|uniref:DUF5753 domain-containing protein n=1 Tax=unclassified Streptomyces TaxID=2593676 RepID=UPI0036B57A20
MAVNIATIAARERFGRDLKGVRVATLLDGEPVGQRQVADALGHKHHDRYSRIERGATWPNAQEWDVICSFLGMDEATRARLSKKRKDGMANSKAWWTAFQGEFPASLFEFISYEDYADRVTTCAGSLVPGLLQTPDYGRAVTGRLSRRTLSEEMVERSLALRANRRRILERPDPPMVEAVIGEAALHQRVGGANVMVGQLDSLTEDIRQRNVIVRVIPFSAPAPLTYLFHLFEFNGTSEDPIAAYDGVTGMSFEKGAKEVRGIRSLLDSAKELALSSQDTLELIQTLRKEMARDQD